MRYFIGKDGKQLGPFTDVQVRAKLKAGEASYDDLGWHEGLPEWRPLRTLFSNVSSSPFNPPGLGTSSAPFQSASAATQFTPETEEFVPNLGGRGSRLGAYLLDQLFVLVLALPGLWPMFQLFMQDIQAGQSPTPEQIMAKLMASLALLLIPVLLFVIVQIVLLVKRGQTVGKMLLGLRIVKLDGSNPGFVSVILLRGLVPAIIGGIPMVGGLFSLINILLIFREDRRCIHDMLAGTIVVEA